MAETTGVYLVLSTIGSDLEAERVAEALLEEGLVACVNILPGWRSIYRWKGETVRDEENLLLIKTTAHRYREVESRILELHPYETPEVLAFEAQEGLAGYLRWVGETVDAGTGS